MVFFLIDYDRSLGDLVELRAFSDSDAAEEARLERELDLLRRGSEREIVVLDAESKNALRKTHCRYFETLSSLKEPLATFTESA